jgi:putative cardiolipin synthase
VSRLGSALTIGRRTPRTATACLALAAIVLSTLPACTTLPPGANFPRETSVALAHPEETRLGNQFLAAAREHDGRSGFRLITIGLDGFLARAQMIDAAERTLDLQYYIYRGDETGRLLTEALVRAADRGVRVRVLVDDGVTIKGDEQVLALDAHDGIDVRVFNPFRYRGHVQLVRAAEFLFNYSRLDYRMHNKLIVSDNAIALVGGRNIGNQYFQVDPEGQFADDDVFAAGPVARQLSATFDDYWNSALAIPAAALAQRHRSPTALRQRRRDSGPGHSPDGRVVGGIDYVTPIAAGQPYAGIISGRLPLVWATARVVVDSPDKKNVESGARRGRLMSRPMARTVGAVQTELLMVTPYFVPADEERKLLTELRLRNARVRVLTNSLESTADPIAHSGYRRYRVPLLAEGAELHEIRSLLGNARGSGQTARISRHGNYSLHAKLFVFDRARLYIGSMNFDQRSKRLNTEVGVIIDSPELAQQTVVRFDSMTQPQNAYRVSLRVSAKGGRPRLLWSTEEAGAPVEYTREPARGWWQRVAVWFYSLLPIEREL